MNRRAFLLGIRWGNDRAEESLQELFHLARTASYIPVGSTIASVRTPSPRSFIGAGKMEEIRLLHQRLPFDFLLVDEPISPRQGKNLEDEIGVAVLDRTGIILEIFASRANSREGKLQVELAELLYTFPRLYHKGVELSRLGGKIGTRGPGEPYLEKHRRRIRQRIQQVRRELEALARQRSLRRKMRKKRGFFSFAIIGYTNTGKSSLLNLLARSSVRVDNALFATLDPTVRRLFLPSLPQPVLLIDTVGFIRKLPHSLIEAFHSTLEEVVQSDCLLQVVDASAEDPMRQFEDVRQVLEEIGASRIPTLTLFNKVDLLSKEKLADLQMMTTRIPRHLYISVTRKIGIQALLDAMASFVRAQEMQETPRSLSS